jgi:putative transposase
MISKMSLEAPESHMRDNLKKLYEFIAAPIYNRLSRDLTLKTQSLLVGSMANQELMLTKLLDDMAGFHLELEHLKASLEKGSHASLTNENDEMIVKLLNKADTNLSLIKLANDHQIPTSELFEWKSKYGGMTLAVLKRVRKLESENSRLEQENLVMRAQTGLSQSGT